MPTPDSHPPTTAPALGEGGFEPYLRAAARRPRLVVLVALLVLAGGGAWLLVRPHDENAVAQVLVTPAAFDDDTYTGLAVVRDTSADPTRATQTAAAMLDSPTAAAAAARALGGDFTESRVRSAVRLEPVGGSNVVAVQASAHDTALAIRIADAYVGATLAERRRALSAAASRLIGRLESSARPPSPALLARLTAVSHGFDPSFSPLHAGATPGGPAAPAAWRILAVALFAGLVLGVGLALATDAVERRRRPEPEAEVVPLAAPGLQGVRDLPGG